MNLSEDHKTAVIFALLLIVIFISGIFVGVNIR